MPKLSLKRGGGGRRFHRIEASHEYLRGAPPAWVILLSHADQFEEILADVPPIATNFASKVCTIIENDLGPQPMGVEAGPHLEFHPENPFLDAVMLQSSQFFEQVEARFYHLMHLKASIDQPPDESYRRTEARYQVVFAKILTENRLSEINRMGKIEAMAMIYFLLIRGPKGTPISVEHYLKVISLLNPLYINLLLLPLVFEASSPVLTSWLALIRHPGLVSKIYCINFPLLLCYAVLQADTSLVRVLGDQALGGDLLGLGRPPSIKLFVDLLLPRHKEVFLQILRGLDLDPSVILMIYEVMVEITPKEEARALVSWFTRLFPIGKSLFSWELMLRVMQIGSHLTPLLNELIHHAVGYISPTSAQVTAFIDLACPKVLCQYLPEVKDFKRNLEEIFLLRLLYPLNQKKGGDSPLRFAGRAEFAEGFTELTVACFCSPNLRLRSIISCHLGSRQLCHILNSDILLPCYQNDLTASEVEEIRSWAEHGLVCTVVKQYRTKWNRSLEEEEEEANKGISPSLIFQSP